MIVFVSVFVIVVASRIIVVFFVVFLDLSSSLCLSFCSRVLYASSGCFSFISSFFIVSFPLSFHPPRPQSVFCPLFVLNRVFIPPLLFRLLILLFFLIFSSTSQTRISFILFSSSSFPSVINNTSKYESARKAGPNNQIHDRPASRGILSCQIIINRKL